MTHRFEHIKGHEALEGGSIWCTLFSDGYLWVGTDKHGLLRYHIETGEVEEFDVERGLYAKSIRSLRMSENGTLWAGTFGRGLFYLLPGEKSFRNFVLNTWKGSDNSVWAIGEAANGELWIGTSSGLKVVDPVNLKAVKEFDGTVLTSSNVQAVYVSSNGEIWCGYPGLGLDRIEMVNGIPNVSNYQHNELTNTGLQNDIVFRIFEDKAGSMWIGTNGGLSRFDPVKQAFQHFRKDLITESALLDNNVWTIFEDRKENLWVGTRNGVSEMNRKTGLFFNYSHVANNVNAPGNNSINSVVVDSKDRIWCGSVGGLFELQLTPTGHLIQWKKYDFREPGPSQDNRVYHLHLDGDYLWLGCKEGVARFHTETHEYIFFQHDPGNANSLSANTTRYVGKDSKNNIWIGTENGLNKLNVNMVNGEEQFTFKHFHNDPRNDKTISENFILSFWEDAHGVYWIGTYGGGLNRMDPVTKEFKAYTEVDGLSNNVIYGVVGGEPGTLWMSTNLGISRFDVAEEEVHQFPGIGRAAE